MLFKFNTFAVLALLFGASVALPSDLALVERGLAYKCKASDPPAQCKKDTAILQAREARGCNVWKCIVEGGAAVSACIAAIDEAGLNPLADIACLGAMTTYINDCDHCFGTCKVTIRNSANAVVGSTCVDAGSSGSIQDAQTGKTITFNSSPSCGITSTGGLGPNESLSHEGKL
ncbi:hypothetical protein K469DRAFT_788247 [Zopfia rhizophila CBS 207.26]|uniref:Fungal calcium binding protein domain-containing protein n=1 Tax=Zopfia rhizophila CBS 207.26 TaxID=1314779 RepID=A0A6A6DX95_9PEZI|nr:hypothetical protein K469DRAFT_788247 [Zopfia rhizophila CBS 207.26]